MLQGQPASWKFTLSVVVFLCPLLLSSCRHDKMSKTEMNKRLADGHQQGKFRTYEVGRDRVIHYLEVGEESKPLVVFVHGSPGSLSVFITYMTDTILLKHTQLISVDRPGFGSSDFGRAEPSLKKQAEFLKPLITTNKKGRPVILVGYSMGGPVVARMAMEYGELIDGIVFVSGAFDPDLEPNQTWWRAPLATPFLKWTLPRSIKASNDELYKLEPELADMVPLWPKIMTRVIILQGTSDHLVSRENAEFARKHLVNAKSVEVIYKEGMDHFIPRLSPESVRAAVLSEVAAIEAGH